MNNIEIKSNRAWREECEALRQQLEEVRERERLLKDDVHNAVELNYSLSQRVKELEGYEQECANLDAELKDYQNCLAELAALKPSQGKPVAWEQRVKELEEDANDGIEEYTQLVSKYVSCVKELAASQQREKEWENLSDELMMRLGQVEEDLAAAPKPEDVK